MAFLMTFGIAMAQSPERGSKRHMDSKARAERITERMAKEFSLNDSQKQKLLTLNLSITDKMSSKQSVKHTHKDKKAGKKECTCKDHKKAPKITKEERVKRHEAMKASRDAYNAKVKEIMTKEQYEAFTKKQAERSAKTKEGHRRPAKRNV